MVTSHVGLLALRRVSRAVLDRYLLGPKVLTKV
jgi:hypothetical protein